MVEPELSLWDLAALVPIVTEAGGTFTDLGGRPGPGGGSAVATNGKLHDEILDRLRTGSASVSHARPQSGAERACLPTVYSRRVIIRWAGSSSPP